MKVVEGGITKPKGFKANGKHIGIKRKRKDLALIFSDVPANVAATFTKNIVKAAPVLWNQKVLKNQSKVKAIVINSGNANACTGEQGKIHAEMMAEETAKCLSLDKNEVLVASTGVIGVHLAIDKICNGIKIISKDLGYNQKSSRNAVEGIMTTDTFIKEIAVEINIKGKNVYISGIAKGSGMIHPNMATMLSFITTDINISKALLQELLSEVVEDTYNMISVDGDTSTNDMVVALANGEAGNSKISSKDDAYEIFREAFFYVNKYLAKEIVRDGEGASKFIEVIVNNAKNKKDAKLLAKSVLTSNLVKTAFFGEDANWGRILCAMGYSTVEFNPSEVSIKFVSNAGEITLIDKGIPIDFNEEKALEILKEKEIQVLIYLESGNDKAIAWGCDLSYEYVKINGEYRT